ncbi:MAG: DedA family protein [Thermoplasmata archaeon]
MTLGGIISYFLSESIRIMSLLGPMGVFFLMVFEGVGLPFPSEVIMVFAGFLAGRSAPMFALYAIAGSVGGFVGNVILYYISYFGGRPIILYIGRYLGLKEEHLERTERWFDSKGEWTVFFGRFVPGFRSYMSIPAGIAKMNISKFSLFTFSGSLIWSTALETGGYFLGKSWEKLLPILTEIGVVLLVAFVAAIGIYIFFAIRKRRILGKGE